VFHPVWLYFLPPKTFVGFKQKIFIDFTSGGLSYFGLMCNGLSIVLVLLVIYGVFLTKHLVDV